MLYYIDFLDWFFGVQRHFQQYFSFIMATSFKAGVPGETTDHGQATGKLYHLRLRVECTFFAIWNAVLVIGLYELLGNPTTLTYWATRAPCYNTENLIGDQN